MLFSDHNSPFLFNSAQIRLVFGTASKFTRQSRRKICGALKRMCRTPGGVYERGKGARRSRCLSSDFEFYLHCTFHPLTCGREGEKSGREGPPLLVSESEPANTIPTESQSCCTSLGNSPLPPPTTPLLPGLLFCFTLSFLSLSFFVLSGRLWEGATGNT